MPLRPARQPGIWGSRGKRHIGFVLAAIMLVSFTSCTPRVQEATPTYNLEFQETTPALFPLTPQEATLTHPPTGTPVTVFGTPVGRMRFVPPPLEIAAASGENIWGVSGGVIVEQDLLNLSQLADSGYKINRTILWWHYLPGYNLLDVYYNKEILHRVEVLVDYHINGSALDGKYYGDIPGLEQIRKNWAADPKKLWAVTLEDEAPGGFRDSQFYGTLSEDIAKYADIYYSETGHTLKPRDQMDREEDVVFNEWMNGKIIWLYNYVYDYVKAHWPELQVFQSLFRSEIEGIYEVRSDGFITDCYGANPWGLYEAVRLYKIFLSDKPLHMILEGVIWDFSQMENGTLVTYRSGSLEQFRREAWITYLSGADAIGWFDWGPQGPGNQNWTWGWQRTDPQGRQVFQYTGKLSWELAKLPLFKPVPEILVIGTDLPASFNKAGFFSEYDIVSERAFAVASLDLSQYRLIVVPGGRYHEETVLKLNRYIEEGGNVIFLGGFGGRSNIYETGQRENTIEMEGQSREEYEIGHIRIEISKPNLLDLDLVYEGLHHETHVLKYKQSENYHTIGNFYWVDENGASRPLTGTLLLYHNESKPDSGWTLYWGGGVSWRSEDYDPKDMSDRFSLYRAIFRAFAEFIGIGEAVASPEIQDMIITQGMLENGMLMAGIDNLRSEKRSLTYRVNLSRFDLPAGEYWVYSLDEGASLGSYTTDGTMLEVPLTVFADGTRLLVISKKPFDPGYRVEIFPEIPQPSP